LAQRLRFSGSFIPFVPRGFGQRLRQDFFNLSLELAVVFDAVLALLDELLAKSFGGALALEETRPAIIDAVKFGRMGLASAMGLAAGAGRQRVAKSIPVVSARPNPAAIARAQTMDGAFPLVTNTQLPALEVLNKYKYQPHLEKRHFLCKSVLEISPVFLKNNDRIEALMLVYFVAQLVAALIERAVRQNMARRGLKTLPILPEARPSLLGANPGGLCPPRQTRTL